MEQSRVIGRLVQTMRSKTLASEELMLCTVDTLRKFVKEYADSASQNCVTGVTLTSMQQSRVIGRLVQTIRSKTLANEELIFWKVDALRKFVKDKGFFVL